MIPSVLTDWYWLICVWDIYYRIKFALATSVKPFQSKPNRCIVFSWSKWFLLIFLISVVGIFTCSSEIDHLFVIKIKNKGMYKYDNAKIRCQTMWNQRVMLYWLQDRCVRVLLSSIIQKISWYFKSHLIDLIHVGFKLKSTTEMAKKIHLAYY